MKTNNITNHRELMIRIEQLKIESRQNEIELTNSVHEFVDGLNPVSIIKNSLHKLTHNDEIKKDVGSLGLNFGLDFLINKIFGRSKTLKGFVGTLFLKGVSGTILNTYSENIINYIKNIKLRKDKSDYTQN